MEFYYEESELLAFAIHAVANNRKRAIKEFNQSGRAWKMYYREDEHFVRLVWIDENGKEKDKYYVDRKSGAGCDFDCWRVTDYGKQLKTVPGCIDYYRAKMTAILELQDWTNL